MSAVATVSAPTTAGARDRRSLLRTPSGMLRLPFVLPTLVALANAAAFLVVQPEVGDLQAALARESAADAGVGLGYWFQWFGGAATPGHYSVLSPYLSSFIGAAFSGAIATVLITPLVYRAARGTHFPLLATWVATLVCALNIWSGRIPFALGCAAGVLALIGLRERRLWLVLGGAVLSVLFSPVTGAFLGMAVFAVFVTEPAYRRFALISGGVCGGALVFVAFYFGAPGPQGWGTIASILVTVFSLFMLIARPAPSVRVMLWLTAIAAPFLAFIPNGMGSNFARLPYICLPPAVIATAAMRRRWAVFALLPALIACAQFTVRDLLLASQPAASHTYYDSLEKELDGLPDVQNFRLQVVQDVSYHTAAFVLLDHVALAGGYETQEQRKLNSILRQPGELTAASYKIWLDNNAVGYVAFDKRTPDDGPEYALVKSGHLPYLKRVWADSTWILYRVRYPTPIVPTPATLVRATQSSMTIRVPCVCAVHLRVHYSKFLTASNAATSATGQVTDDGTGWTVVQVPVPGTYVLKGRPV